MIKEIDITNPIMAVEVLAAQIPAYRVEAKLIGFDDLPPLKDTVDSLQNCGETFFGFFNELGLCGVISMKDDNGALDIHRLFVHPKHFRKGIAKELMDFIVGSQKNLHSITVSTGTGNLPAIHFYSGYGFKKMGERTITDQLSLTYFKKIFS